MYLYILLIYATKIMKLIFVKDLCRIFTTKNAYFLCVCLQLLHYTILQIIS